MGVKDVIADMRAACQKREADMNPHKGMHVPYHGPLAAAVPSVLRDVRWWADRLEDALQEDG